MSIQSAVAPFEFFWASPEGRRLYTPKQQQLFMVQIGAPAGYNVGNPTGPSAGSQFPNGFYANDFQGDNEFGQGLAAEVDQSLSGYIWFAKSINKPELSFSEAPHSQLRTFRDLRSYRPIRLENAPVYSPITLRMIDPTSPTPTRKLLNVLKMSGLGSDDFRNLDMNQRYDRGFDDVLNSAFLDPVRIYQYGHLPNADVFEPRGRLYLLEKWELVDPKISSLNFGELDYSSGDFVEINLTLSINGFKCTTYDVPGPGGATAQNEATFRSVKDTV